MKIDANWLKALSLAGTALRLFVNITAENAVGVIDRNQHSVTTNWPIPADTPQNLPLFLES
jgi:hypothetical protein